MAGPSLDALRTIPLLRAFADEDLAALGEQFTRAETREGGVLFDVGEQGTGFYLLTAGEVTLECPGDETFRMRPPALISSTSANWSR